MISHLQMVDPLKWSSFVYRTGLSAVGVGLVGEVGAGAAGIARGAVLLLLVAIEAGVAGLVEGLVGGVVVGEELLAVGGGAVAVAAAVVGGAAADGEEPEEAGAEG